MPKRFRALLAALSLVLLTVAAYGDIPGLAMLGWDGWPLVAASRVGSLGDLVGTFGEPLMDGRYPHGRFYRPVTHLCFAIDEWINGLNVQGYHHTDLALLAACGLCLAALVSRLAGGWAGLIAGALFLLHPAQLEVVTVPARRADTLALLFGLGCLLAQTKHPTGRRSLLILALAALAAGSKETGVWIAPAAVGWYWLQDRQGLGASLRASRPALAGVALYLAARSAVLGGLGGHEGEVGQAVSKTQLWSGLMEGTLYPEPIFGVISTPGLLVLCAGLALAWLPVFRLETRALGFSLVMGASLLAITSLADRLHAWYAVLFTAPLAIACSVAVVRGLQLLREGRRWHGLCAAATPLLLLCSFILGSPLVRDYPRLEAASRWLESSYSRVERALPGYSQGQVLQVDSWPIGVRPLPGGLDVQSLALAREYTLEAYLELHHPGLKAKVQLFDGLQRATPIPGHLVVELIPGVPPGWLEEASRAQR